MPTGGETFDAIAKSLEHDMRLRFPDVRVLFRGDEQDGYVCEISGEEGPWGSVGVWPDRSDSMTAAEAERFAAEVASDVVDNLWPDEAIDPWPVCPRHNDHPLHVAVRRGRASWACRQDDDIAIPLGQLTDRT